MITRRLAPLCALVATGCLGSASAFGSYSGSVTRRRDNSPRLVDSYDLVVSVPETAPRRAFRNVHVDIFVSATPADSTTDIETYAVASIARAARPVVADSVAVFLGAKRDLDAADLPALRAPLRDIAQRQLVGWISKDRTPQPYRLRLDLVGLYFADGPSAAPQSRSSMLLSPIEYILRFAQDDKRSNTAVAAPCQRHQRSAFSRDCRPIIRKYSRSHAAGMLSRGEYGPGE